MSRHALTRNIFLIGFMASGKTTLCDALSDATGCATADLDEVIERRAGKSITEIFRDSGEAGFRAMESDILRELAISSQPRIIACGGGTPCNDTNLRIMKENGLVVWLKPDIGVILRRLAENRAARPKLASLSDAALEAHVRSMLEARNPYYSRAHCTFGTSRLESPRQIAAAVRRFIKRFMDVKR